MPRYKFECRPCDEHKEHFIDEVFMSISTFEDGGKNQTCKVCGKQMKQIYSMPAVIYKGSGFYSTDYPKPVPQNEVADMENELENYYFNKSVRSGDLDEAKAATETVLIDEFQDTKTGKKVHKLADERQNEPRSG